jgi:hypothetical protein
MAISKVNPVAAGSSVSGKAYTLTWQNVYKTTDSFSSGIYVITTSPTTYQARVEFVLSDNTVVTATTVSGTVTVSLGQAATEVYLHILESAGTGTILTINQTAATIGVSNYSGTLDTISTTSNYNQTGKLYVVAVGGGGNGGGSQSNSNAGAGGGGGSGAVNGKLVYTNAATAITIGTAGGGTTNFGNLVSALGGENGRTGGDSQGNGGPGGSPYGGSGGKGALNGAAPQLSNAPEASASPYVSIIGNITTGGGGGGGASGKAATNGAGSGIGTGGNGGSTLAVNGGNATGYGAGGGGGGARSAAEVNTTGGSGTAGVVYVLRGF